MDKNNHSFGQRFQRYYLPTLLIVALILILWMTQSNPPRMNSDFIPNEHLLEIVIGYIVLGAELAAAFVVATAGLHAVFSYLRGLLDKSLTAQIKSSESIRLRMGHKLSLALEFAVAADILRLAISPTASDLLVLFAIILLRILLNYFLEHDIERIREYKLVPELDQAYGLTEDETGN